jgi:two-component system nitrogen regulation sensor histidine kinase GlnL
MAKRLPRALGVWFEHLKTAVLVLEPARRILYLNPAAEALLGQSVRQLKKQYLRAVFSDISELEKLFQRSQESESLYCRDWPLETVFGQRFSADLILSQYDFGYILEFHQHLTKGHEHNPQWNLLLRTLAHELKNPLSGLSGAAQLLQKENKSPEINEYSEVILREVKRLQKITEDMLAPSGAGRQWNNLHQALEHVLHLLRPLLHEQQVEVERHYDPSIPLLWTHWDHLIQVFLNIIKNALEAMREAQNPKLMLTTQVDWQNPLPQHHGAVRIEITDNGSGIAPEHLPLLFTPLFTNKKGGSGLGLAISKHLLQENKGHISCDSRFGRTIFRIWLPLPKNGQPL